MKPAFFFSSSTPGVASACSAREAGARHERERDEEQPGVAELAGRLSRQVPEHDADQRRDQDEPEVGRMDAPSGRPARARGQERQADQGERSGISQRATSDP